MLVRSVFRGHVRAAMPHTLVEETADLVVLYLAPGTRGKLFSGAPLHRITDVGGEDWSLGDVVWSRTHRLCLTPLHEAHSLDLFWDEEDWRFRCWYVNLQEQLRRTPFGFDTRDQALDVVIKPDGSWSWKDEEHFEEATRHGHFTAEEARAVRCEAESVVADLDRLVPTGWEDWRPDPAWPLPSLPSGWDKSM